MLDRSWETLAEEDVMNEAALDATPAIGDEASLWAHSTEVARQLRAAAMKGDQELVTRLLSDLLQYKRAGSGRKGAVLALTQLIDSLRSVAWTDELTGVYNRRGFLEAGARFLRVARRDLQPAYLVYFDLNSLKEVNDTAGHAAGDVLIRQTANFLRELFPNYGVYEVLARLGGDEFAALTTDMQCPSRSEILLRARMPRARGADVPPLSLSVGFAYFNPLLPTDMNELLKSAERAMYEHKRVNRTVPSELCNYRRKRAESRNARPAGSIPRSAPA
jgi:diguanylate cyclase (GGDEF)-like protein